MNGWKVLYFHAKKNAAGDLIPDSERSKRGFTKAHICHPNLVKAVLKDLQDRHPGPDSIPLEIIVDDSTCIDIGGMICTTDKRLVLKLTCDRTVEFWPHHIPDILFDLECRLKAPENSKYWRGPANRRWTKLHVNYFCYCLTKGDVKALVLGLQKLEKQASSQEEFFLTVRKKIGPTPYVLLPGEPGHPIQSFPAKERN